MSERGERGFTLVELLVGLVVLAFLMQLAFGALRFGATAWERVSEQAVDLDERASVMRFLRARLETLSQPNPPRGGAANSVQWWFAGDADAMEFVTLWDRPVAPTGLYRFRVWQERENGQGVLYLSWHPHLPGASDALRAQWSGEREILRGVDAITLRYFGADPGETPYWQDTWSRKTISPDLVEIVIARQDADESGTRLVLANRF